MFGMRERIQFQQFIATENNFVKERLFDESNRKKTIIHPDDNSHNHKWLGWGSPVIADNSANLETVAAWNMTAATEMSASIPATGGKNKQNAIFSNWGAAVPTVGNYAKYRFCIYW